MIRNRLRNLLDYLVGLAHDRFCGCTWGCEPEMCRCGKFSKSGEHTCGDS